MFVGWKNKDFCLFRWINWLFSSLWSCFNFMKWWGFLIVVPSWHVYDPSSIFFSEAWRPSQNAWSKERAKKHFNKHIVVNSSSFYEEIIFVYIDLIIKIFIKEKSGIDWTNNASSWGRICGQIVKNSNSLILTPLLKQLQSLGLIFLQWSHNTMSISMSTGSFLFPKQLELSPVALTVGYCESSGGIPLSLSGAQQMAGGLGSPDINHCPAVRCSRSSALTSRSCHCSRGSHLMTPLNGVHSH